MIQGTAGFIYARSDSSRLPGKPMYEIGNRRLIDIVFARAGRINVADNILLTTDRPVDDGLVDYCKAQGYTVFRGDAFNLVRRTLQALETFHLEGFVRINADCPLLEPSLINIGLAQMSQSDACVSNLFHRSYPYGIAVECVSAALFQKLASSVAEAEKEHVTSHLYRLREQFNRISMENSAENQSDVRLTIDTPEDYSQMCRLAAQGDIVSDPYWKLCGIGQPQTCLIQETAGYDE
ncbi:NTP transferase domain-containing protein [Marinobacter sp. CHS3-4]|uniref:cytidylyltransferase domain-containing protein n=1 Tax=Marinobacter sp. CHS3-4 TaxID=3045174 RepID=UPI0024B5E4DB|nr:NTP transferase domain-containing protein [Marinobacter sp. CHS3-4]MDI9244976.1 NTP transferase domain-containing protein [Marinobacter sp. CHS3-4]